MALTANKLRTTARIVATITACVALLSLAGPAMAQTAYQSRPTQSPATQRGTQPLESFAALDAATPRFTGDEVLITVGSSIQQAVDSHAAGTHFRIAAGIHRNQQVTPKDGNTFTGETGAVLSGARVLNATSFVRQGSTWVLSGQTDETTFHGITVPGRERHAAVQDLWLGDTLADHVNSRGEVNGPGEWFYDYDADQIVMFDNPATFPAVELAVTKHAFEGTAADVTIEHLTITRYAQRAQQGAIHGDEARGWTIRFNTITANHGVNVRVGAGFHVHNNSITKAGQLGIGGLDNFGGYQAQLVVEDNEIADNHTLGYDWQWEAGGTKFVLTTDMLFHNNWVHHNSGPGAWFDIDNRDAVISSNLVEHNTIVGIFYEISYGAEIFDNTSRYNGSEAIGDMGGGVYVSTSSDVEIHHNLLYGNRSEIIATQGDRGTGNYGRYELTGMDVHHNDITIGLVSIGVRVEHGDDDHYRYRAGNTFNTNIYRTNAGDYGFWTNTHSTWADWQAKGFDTASTLLPSSSAPVFPGLTPFVPAAYGA